MKRENIDINMCRVDYTLVKVAGVLHDQIVTHDSGLAVPQHTKQPMQPAGIQ